MSLLRITLAHSVYILYMNIYTLCGGVGGRGGGGDAGQRLFGRRRRFFKAYGTYAMRFSSKIQARGPSLSSLSSLSHVATPVPERPATFLARPSSLSLNP